MRTRMHSDAASSKLQQAQQPTWRAPLHHSCGDCSAEDAVACCLVCNAAWAAHGWNASKVLRLSFWREAAKFLTLTVGAAVLAESAVIAVDVACTAPTADDRPTYDAHSIVVHRHHAPLHTPACEHARVGVSVFAVLVLLAAWMVYGVMLGGRRRMLREELGVQQGGCDDVAVHLFCSSCAIMQETRTILHMEAQGVLGAQQADEELVGLLTAPAGDSAMDRSSSV